MIKFTTRIIVALSASLTFSAFGCSLGGLQHTIKFSQNDSSIGMEEAKKLVQWYSLAKERFGISYVWFGVFYMNEVKQTIPVAQARYDNIIRLLKSLDKEKVKFESGIGPFEDTPKKYRLSEMDEVNIGIQPKCTETESCCGGRYKN